MKKAGGRQRKLSAGTVFMLAMLAVVLIGSALVIGRLSSGATVDLTKLNMRALNFEADPSQSETEKTAPRKETENRQTAESKQEAQSTGEQKPRVIQNEGASFSLTIGGSFSLSGEVRKNSWNTDSKVADYADVMMLLRPWIRSDINGVFLENIISARSKASDTVAPESAAALLKEAGFGMAACGFAQAFANGKDGVEDTLSALSRQGISALGIRSAEDPGKPEVKTVNGVRVSFLQYTSGIPSKTRKNMERDETSGMVPEAEIDLISEEIDSARAQGAEAVIVLLNWGKTGKDPDKAQRELAELIAQAGADLIIGNGSHVPQSAEYLSGRDGGSVLCVWSLGSLLSGDRSNVRRMSGYLFHVTVKSNGQGGADILNPEYTPVYTWKYKQDGRWYYRCIASDTETPDGMDNEQRKMMNKAAETVETMLKDSPLTERGAGHAD